MTRYGVAESPNSVAIFTVYGFLLGIVLVSLYAAMRPLLGPGPKRAVMAALYKEVDEVVRTGGATAAAAV